MATPSQHDLEGLLDAGLASDDVASLGPVDVPAEQSLVADAPEAHQLVGDW